MNIMVHYYSGHPDQGTLLIRIPDQVSTFLYKHVLFSPRNMDTLLTLFCPKGVLISVLVTT